MPIPTERDEHCRPGCKLPLLYDERDLFAIEAALDALERLHDGEYWSSEPHVGERIRECLCSEASSWRGARKVTVYWREQLGLRVRLLDRV